MLCKRSLTVQASEFCRPCVTDKTSIHFINFSVILAKLMKKIPELHLLVKEMKFHLQSDCYSGLTWSRKFWETIMGFVGTFIGYTQVTLQFNMLCFLGLCCQVHWDELGGTRLLALFAGYYLLKTRFVKNRI